MTKEEILRSVKGSEDEEYFYIENGVLFHDLEEMPFDYSPDGFTFVHATGREFWYEEFQRWYLEYEDGSAV